MVLLFLRVPEFQFAAIYSKDPILLFTINIFTTILVNIDIVDIIITSLTIIGINNNIIITSAMIFSYSYAIFRLSPML